MPDEERSADMRLLGIRAFLVVVALTLSSCQTGRYPESTAADAVLEQRAVGKWVRDETYPYGRFIGELQLSEDRTGTREFGVIDSPGDPLRPLLTEVFRWHVEKGYIVYTDRKITDMESTSPHFRKSKKDKEHRELISSLTEETMETLDPWKKTDKFRRVKSEK